MKYRTQQQRNQVLTRILFIVMFIIGIVAFLFSLVSKLIIPSLESMGYWLTSLGLGFILWGAVGMYYTRYHYVGQVAVSRFANSGSEIIMIAGVCIIGLVFVFIGTMGLFNWLRTI